MMKKMLFVYGPTWSVLYTVYLWPKSMIYRQILAIHPEIVINNMLFAYGPTWSVLYCLFMARIFDLQMNSWYWIRPEIVINKSLFVYGPTWSVLYTRDASLLNSNKLKVVKKTEISYHLA